MGASTLVPRSAYNLLAPQSRIAHGSQQSTHARVAQRSLTTATMHYRRWWAHQHFTGGFAAALPIIATTWKYECQEETQRERMAALSTQGCAESQGFRLC